MPKVLVVNNYPLAGVWQEVKNGQTPDQYLFGINYFHERNHKVELIDFQADPFLDNIEAVYRRLRLPIPIGNLEQQAHVLSAKDADLIYSPCQTQTHLLAYMRALGLLKTPLVCLAHQPLNTGRLAYLREPITKLMVSGCDSLPSISRLLSAGIDKRYGKSIGLTWGPDKDFYHLHEGKGNGIVSAGRTGRDFNILGKAASKANVQTHIVCLQSSKQPSFSEFSNCVKVTIRPDSKFMPYSELMQLYGQARALAIPLYSNNHTNGISSLIDALAMGKPVVMTRNPYMDIDIESLGIGRWVELGDEDGWVEALTFFDKNPDAAAEMGKRGRDLVDSGINSQTFANQVMDIFDKVL